MLVVISTSVLISGFAEFSSFNFTTSPTSDVHTSTAILFNEEKSTGSSIVKNEPAQTSAPLNFKDWPTVELVLIPLASGLGITVLWAFPKSTKE